MQWSLRWHSSRQKQQRAGCRQEEHHWGSWRQSLPSCGIRQLQPQQQRQKRSLLTRSEQRAAAAELEEE